MEKIDRFITGLLRWARTQPLLYRFTLGTRILLAVGFIPTGAVKMMGLRFAAGLGTDTQPGALFEMLYQSGYYWWFLGFTQVLAGLLILWERTSAVGAILFLAVISNIFLITISYEFNYTYVITLNMLLASIWLIFWEWHRIRNLFSINDVAPIEVAYLSLSGNIEKVIYGVGLFAGLAFFSILRGLPVPMSFTYVLLALCLVSFILAFVFGIRYRKKPALLPADKVMK